MGCRDHVLSLPLVDGHCGQHRAGGISFATAMVTHPIEVRAEPGEHIRETFAFLLRKCLFW